MAMNFVTFNQDNSHLAVATSRGFRIYTTEPFEKCVETKHGDVSMTEMLFSTSLVAIVVAPRQLHIKNTKRQSTICELTFPAAILAVRMNRLRLVVVLEDLIYVYDMSTMKILHTLETSPNPNAICALSSSSENCYLAFPLPQKAPTPQFQPPPHAPPGASQHIPPTSGDVLLVDAAKLESVNVVTAHKSPLSCITINNTGTLLATASEKGTIIRVFSIRKGDKLYQFRRGAIPSTIFSMSFNVASSLLCISSASETVHIFKLGGSQQRPASALSSNSQALPGRDRSASPESQDVASTPPSEEAGMVTASRKHNGTFLGMIRRTSQNVSSSLVSSVGAYLPSAVSEMWEPTRDFAWCKIPRNPASNTATSPPSLRSVVAMSNNSPQVMVVTNEGRFYVFGIDLEKGGEGALVKVYEIGETNERLAASTMDD
ncbi:MAG: autophagy protein [Gomphillus americanus]|uniref:Autophagy protein n=1 Tax=Gomphillus americanus TaxID=1940652 RepID=A0A8H3EG50_9LECA|nr:MAG: autophagy protein [Gomphillus americanus]